MKTPSMIPRSRCENLYSDITDEQAESLIEPYLCEEKNPSRYAVRDILRYGFEDYIKIHPVPYQKEKVVRAIMACGTGELGYTLSVCEDCNAIRMIADKCGSRYCCGCGFLKQLKWQQARRSENIDGIPYYHIVFTVPHELNDLIFQNQKELISNLFNSAKDTILQLTSEKEEMIPGIQMVLHTFSSSLLLHYHIHMLVSGGGLSPDKKSFKKLRSKKYFLPVSAISDRYRSLFIEGIKTLRDERKLNYFGDAERFRNSYEWNELLNTCYEKKWNVEIKKYRASSEDDFSDPTAASFPAYASHPAVSPEAIHDPHMDDDTDDPEVSTAVEYISRYTDRSAITDNRIRSWDNNEVSFDYKDYRAGGAKKIMTITVEEFIRRFLLHILPDNVTKIRYGGFLAGCVKTKNLALIRRLLEQSPPEDPTKDMTSSELAEYFYSADFAHCPCCKGHMLNVGHRMKLKNVAQRINAFSARAS